MVSALRRHPKITWPDLVQSAPRYGFSNCLPAIAFLTTVALAKVAATAGAKYEAQYYGKCFAIEKKS